VSERTQQLTEEQERTEAILRSMADALVVFDAENRILTANRVAEEMLDFRLSEMVGQKVGSQELVSPLWRCVDQLSNNVDIVATALVDVPSAQPDSPLSIQAYSARVRNQIGQVIGTVITLRDITTLKEVERMKGRFLSGVTHELKTPLSVIQLQAGNLLRYQERLPPQKRNQLLNSIQTQAQHLEQLIEDILALSRLDGEVASASRRMVDLVELVDRVITHLRPLAEAKQIDLVWSKPGGKVTIWVNLSQIEQLLRNLIDNAIKFTPSGGKVEVQVLVESTAQKAENVRIRVTDTGPGIPAEYHDQVFDRFYRLDPSHTTAGTGLGLAIVKEVVEAHNGKLYLASQPGQGSTFLITLPLANHSGE
jgi:signal transduction histidine kinase